MSSSHHWPGHSQKKKKELRALLVERYCWPAFLRVFETNFFKWRCYTISNKQIYYNTSSRICFTSQQQPREGEQPHVLYGVSWSIWPALAIHRALRGRKYSYCMICILPCTSFRRALSEVVEREELTAGQASRRRLAWNYEKHGESMNVLSKKKGSFRHQNPRRLEYIDEIVFVQEEMARRREYIGKIVFGSQDSNRRRVLQAKECFL